MSRRFILSPDAQRDYEEIWDYIAADSVLAADNVVDTFTEKFALIATQSDIGKSHPELGEGLRAFRASRYMIFYRKIEDGIEVVRVIHGARDIPSLFNPL